MGKAPIPNKSESGGRRRPAKPGERHSDIDVADGTLQAEAAAGGRGHGTAGDASRQPVDAEAAPQQGDAGDLSERDALHDEPESQAGRRRRHMRRILPRVDQLRLAINALNAAVVAGTEDGLAREAIVEAIGYSTDDPRLQYLRLSECADLLLAVRSPVAFDLIRLDEKPVSSLPMRIDAATDDGYHAETIGRAIDACPYGREQGELRNAWRKGWSASRGGKAPE